jgi:hypothetical protein
MTSDLDVVQILHADAWQAYRQGFPEVAGAIFRKILQRDPNSTWASDAKYYLTHGYQFPADRAETQHAERPLRQANG